MLCIKLYSAMLCVCVILALYFLTFLTVLPFNLLFQVSCKIKFLFVN